MADAYVFRIRNGLFAGMLSLAVLLAGCGAAQTAEAPDGKWKVTATTGMVADIVKQVGSDAVDERWSRPSPVQSVRGGYQTD
jgi:manganese/zinc/iron transport system substrate-binding protein